MSERRPGPARGLGLVVGSVALAVAAGVAVVVGPSSLPVLLAVLAGLVALLRPAWGLLGYLTLAALLPPSEGIAPAEVATFGLLAWLLLLGTFRVLHRPPRDRLPGALVRSVYAGLAVVLLSGLVAWRNGLAPTDWARDVVPLANLALIVLVPAFVTHPGDVRWLRTAFVALLGCLGLGSVLMMSWQIGGEVNFSSPLQVGGTWVTPMLVAAGAAAISEFPRPRLGYLLLGALGLVAAVLTPTRTVWMGVLVVALVSVLLNLCAGAKYAWRNAVLVVFIALLTGALLLLWRSSGNVEAWAAQQERFASLGDLRDDQSLQIRGEQFREAMQHFADHPWLGVGLGYQYFYKVDVTSKYDEGTNFNHCDPANYLCKTGLLGTAVLYWLWVVAIILGGRLRREAPTPQDRWYAAFARTSLLAALITGLSCPVLQDRGATFLLGLTIGLLAASPTGRAEADRGPQTTAAPRAGGAAAVRCGRPPA